MSADVQRRLLVLGAGRHQVPLITRAEERGIGVIAVSNIANDPGKAVATWSAEASALDTPEVLAIARRHDTDGVVTTGTDMAVVTMADVAAELGLPCHVTPETARAATDKERMSVALEAAGGNRPRHVHVDAAEGAADVLEHLRLPVVVKPADSQGQRGISIVHEVADLERSLTAAVGESRSGRAIVEEFLTGPEVTASAWVSGGDLHVLMVTDRITYNPPPSIGIAIRHVSPSRHAAGHIDAVTEQVAAVARAYDMTDGPLYVQMLMTEHGVVLVEAGARIGGGHEADLIPAVSGVDVIDAMIDLAMTGTAGAIDYRCSEESPGNAALVEFLLARPGEVVAASGFPSGDPAEVAGGFYVGPGYVHGPTVNALSRVGWFLAVGRDRAELVDNADRIHRGLELRGPDGTNLLFVAEPELVNG